MSVKITSVNVIHLKNLENFTRIGEANFSYCNSQEARGLHLHRRRCMAQAMGVLLLGKAVCTYVIYLYNHMNLLVRL